MQRTATILLFALASAGLKAQNDRKDMYLPVLVEVRANNGPTERFSVSLYKDNELVVELPPSKEGAFQLELDLDSRYTAVINKSGFRTKSVAFDTSLPGEVRKYEEYTCVIDLDPEEKFVHSDPFYLDFPSALVRWDPAKNSFDHSDAYLADIQLKVALLGAQLDTN